MNIPNQSTKTMSNIAYSLYIALLLLPCFEVALLILGYRPFHQVEYHIEASPENCIISHPTLGFALLPGNYEVTLNQGSQYFVRHGRDSLRVTTHKINDPARDSIYFFGCSYTYGMGLSDSLTFPFLVQQNMPGYCIKNFGVPGYGTVQTWLQLKQLIASYDIPATVVVNYADFHDDRNSLTPAYRRDLYLGYQRSHASVVPLMQKGKIPYLSKDLNDGQIHFCEWANIYHNWKYRETFAVVNFLQEWSDRSQTRTIDMEENTRRIFAVIRELCEQQNIRLIVTGITSAKKTKQLLKDLEVSGIETLDISVDLSLKKYRNAPYDDHPNELAHSIFAEKIMGYLLH